MRRDPEGSYVLRSELEAANARIAELEARSAEPVAHFINDAPDGMKPHYAQIDEQFASNPDVFPLYRAPVADSAMVKDARFDALKRAGARMANTMFNMAQRSGEELDNHLCEKLAQMQKEWDAALNAIAASAEKGDKA
jgi:hypothetical protein